MLTDRARLVIRRWMQRRNRVPLRLAVLLRDHAVTDLELRRQREIVPRRIADRRRRTGDGADRRPRVGALGEPLRQPVGEAVARGGQRARAEPLAALRSQPLTDALAALGEPVAVPIG